MDKTVSPTPAVPAASAPARRGAGLPASGPRLLRQLAVADARRAMVLDAARSAFFELGLEGASLREIAKRAGYSPGAIYSYFASKEEVYAALLGESLERLNARVAAATGEPGSDAAPALLRRAADAFFEFYRENPRDLDLGFYLFHGMQPRGLTPALNEPLNRRLRDALLPLQAALRALGLPEAEVQAEVTALFAHCVGLLLLSHTGRIRMFRQDSQALFVRYLDALVTRASAPATRTGGAAPRRPARRAMTGAPR